MPVATDRIDFAPPATGGNLRALLLALVAHGLLLLALTWGVNWKRQDTGITAEAELWSALPQQAAPKLAAPPPAPVPPQPVAPPPPEPSTAQREADIALEREKQQKAKERAQALREQELEKAALKKEADEREKAKRDAAKLAASQKATDKQAAASAQKKLEAARAEEETKQAEARRQDNIRRAQGLAGATGDASSTGKAQTSSGPSAGYAGRIRARIKPNIVFTDDIAGNPEAEVTVRVAPDGTIVGKRLTKSSGNKAWDDAVLKAIDKTEVLPRDTDGRVVPEFPVSFRPRD